MLLGRLLNGQETVQVIRYCLCDCSQLAAIEIKFLVSSKSTWPFICVSGLSTGLFIILIIHF